MGNTRHQLMNHFFQYSECHVVVFLKLNLSSSICKVSWFFYFTSMDKMIHPYFSNSRCECVYNVYVSSLLTDKIAKFRIVISIYWEYKLLKASIYVYLYSRINRFIKSRNLSVINYDLNKRYDDDYNYRQTSPK